MQLSILKKLPLRSFGVSAIALDIITVICIVLLSSKLPPVVPLLYGRPIGAAQLVPGIGLVIAPVAAMCISIINIFIAYRIKDDFSKRIFVVSSFFISVLVAITVIKIILLVGFW
jgi:hypothetical protein